MKNLLLSLLIMGLVSCAAQNLPTAEENTVAMIETVETDGTTVPGFETAVMEEATDPAVEENVIDGEAAEEEAVEESSSAQEEGTGQNEAVGENTENSEESQLEAEEKESKECKEFKGKGHAYGQEKNGKNNFCK